LMQSQVEAVAADVRKLQCVSPPHSSAHR